MGWLLDSGATHHVTHDLDNLALHSPYDGTEELIIGDGLGLAISNTGSTSLLTNTTTFNLNHIICVPFIFCNIVSISKFCHDNITSITFLPNSSVVKDLHTGALLLQGPTKSDIYEWHPTCPAVHSIKLSSITNWHHHLDYHLIPFYVTLAMLLM
ncbi:hypothetical protein IHE45_02G032900 [Dioscorea alata]|uniref:Uncharacterized protein n=1 Tax=Dioscorea alata TaxID=55571 RepID=A0ACB7WNX2_DIOAL|nr:hypothetical protein IHE45_02G032900 [Dioscorea alata]